MAGLVVDAAGRSLDRLEDDVLVEARDHPVGQLDARRRRAGRGGRGRRRSSTPTISSRRSICTSPSAAVNSLIRWLEALAPRSRACRSCGRHARTRQTRGRARQACRPRRSRSSSSHRASRSPASPQLPGRRPFQLRAVGVGAVLDQEDPVLAAVVGDPLDLEGDVAADVDEPGRPRPVPLRLRARSPRTRCRGPRGCSRRTPAWRRPRGRRAGVAMKVFDGQSTVSPAHARELERRQRRRRSSRRTRRPRAVPGAPRRASKRSTTSPSVQRRESSTSSQSSCSRARSRWSNPIANAPAARQPEMSHWRGWGSCFGEPAR